MGDEPINHTVWTRTVAPRCRNLSVHRGGWVLRFGAHTLAELLVQCPHLLILKLKLYLPPFDAFAALQACRHLSTLEQLTIELEGPPRQGTDLLSMDWAQTLASYCPNLEYIYLRGCKMPILAYPLFSKITEVNLINCNPDMTMTQVAQVLRACPHVVQLKICADFSVVEAGALAEAVKEVKIERICMCLSTTSAAALQKLMQSADSLTQVELADCALMGPTILAMMAALPSGQLKKLIVKEEESEALSDDLVAKMLELQPQMTTLVFPNAGKITPAVLPVIATGARQLTELSVHYCPALYEQATSQLEKFVNSLHALRRLVVCWSRDIDDMSREDAFSPDVVVWRAASERIADELNSRGGEFVVLSTRA